eukprot:469185-Alexandrium_andersonii.AAC.1
MAGTEGEHATARHGTRAARSCTKGGARLTQRVLGRSVQLQARPMFMRHEGQYNKGARGAAPQCAL